jgi:hypothetical protein
MPRRCGDDGQWHYLPCGPLRIGDLVNINASAMPGFSVSSGFRCKSLSVCGVAQSCYYGLPAQNLGSLQSMEMMYYDGSSFIDAVAVKINIAVGAASQCMDPPITLQAGESIVLSFGNNQTRAVYFPAFNGKSLLLYVREDGSTFYDAALTMLAQKAK